MNFEDRNLLHASLDGRLDRAMASIMRGANVNCSDSNGDTALIRASKFNHINIVKLLIEVYSANINAQNTFGFTALYYASKNRLLDIVKLLVKNGAIITEQYINVAGTEKIRNYLIDMKTIITLVANSYRKKDKSKDIIHKLQSYLM